MSLTAAIRLLADTIPMPEAVRRDIEALLTEAETPPVASPAPSSSGSDAVAVESLPAPGAVPSPDAGTDEAAGTTPVNPQVV